MHVTSWSVLQNSVTSVVIGMYIYMQLAIIASHIRKDTVASYWQEKSVVIVCCISDDFPVNLSPTTSTLICPVSTGE